VTLQVIWDEASTGVSLAQPRQRIGEDRIQPRHYGLVVGDGRTGSIAVVEGTGPELRDLAARITALTDQLPEDGRPAAGQQYRSSKQLTLKGWWAAAPQATAPPPEEGHP
jgi:hypothetical protein